MTDGEVRKVIAELDAALALLRKHLGRRPRPAEVRIGVRLADLRRELAMYRAIATDAERKR